MEYEHTPSPQTRLLLASLELRELLGQDDYEALCLSWRLPLTGRLALDRLLANDLGGATKAEQAELLELSFYEYERRLQSAAATIVERWGGASRLALDGLRASCSRR
jgi:hypothetical protein